MTIFEYQDYKEYLSDLIKGQGSLIRGYQTHLAEAAGCQKAYISQVLYGSVHLTFDHAVGLCNFWQFKQDETDYFIELLQLARAGTPALRLHVTRRLDAIKARQSELSSKFKSTSKLKEEHQATYYSNPNFAAIHVLTSISSFQREKQIAERLGIPTHQVLNLLSQLEKMNLVEKKSDRWRPTENNLFLPRQSYMNHMHHSNWRVKSLEDVQKDTPDSLHYSTLHALSRKDAEILRQKVLDFLKETKAIVEPSPEEEMVCLCVDYFRV